MTKILTTLSQEYWDKVGQYTIPTWKPNMPDSWELWLHDSPEIPVSYDVKIDHTEKYNWINNAEHTSKSCVNIPVGYQSEWKMFCHKSFAMWETYEKQPNGILVWCDSDVKWNQPLNDETINQCLGDKFCGYLGRDRVDTSKTAKKKYSKLTPETCFIVFNLDHPIASEFFKKFKQVYISLELFDLYSWCDAAVFEHIMNQFPKEHFNDITINNPPAIAPLPLTFLNDYIEHWMGWTNKTARADISGQKEKQKMIKRGVL